MPAKGQKPYNAVYDWEKLFRKKEFSLTQGIDYTCQPHTMSQQVRNAAVRLRKEGKINVRPSVTIDGTILRVVVRPGKKAVA